MAKTNLFHVQETILTQNGFKKQVIDEKNSHTDTINTMRIQEFTKEITPELSVEINYTYLTEDEKQYKLYSSSVILKVHDSYTGIPVKKLSDLLMLIVILTGE